MVQEVTSISELGEIFRQANRDPDGFNFSHVHGKIDLRLLENKLTSILMAQNRHHSEYPFKIWVYKRKGVYEFIFVGIVQRDFATDVKIVQELIMAKPKSASAKGFFATIKFVEDFCRQSKIGHLSLGLISKGFDLKDKTNSPERLGYIYKKMGFLPDSRVFVKKIT